MVTGAAARLRRVFSRQMKHSRIAGRDLQNIDPTCRRGKFRIGFADSHVGAQRSDYGNDAWQRWASHLKRSHEPVFVLRSFKRESRDANWNIEQLLPSRADQGHGCSLVEREPCVRSKCALREP